MSKRAESWGFLSSTRFSAGARRWFIFFVVPSPGLFQVWCQCFRVLNRGTVVLSCDQRKPKKNRRPEVGAGGAGTEHHQPVCGRQLSVDPWSLFFGNPLPLAGFLLHCYLLAPMRDLLPRTQHIFIDSNEMYMPPRNLGIAYLNTTTKKTSQE